MKHTIAALIMMLVGTLGFSDTADNIWVSNHISEWILDPAEMLYNIVVDPECPVDRGYVMGKILTVANGRGIDVLPMTSEGVSRIGMEIDLQCNRSFDPYTSRNLYAIATRAQFVIYLFENGIHFSQLAVNHNFGRLQLITTSVQMSIEVALIATLIEMINMYKEAHFENNDYTIRR